ncbi:MAG: PAS domain S-box protein [Candidatus Sulfobium sp.]
MDKTIRILMIDDNPMDVRLTRAMLKRSLVKDLELESAERLSEGLQRLMNEKFDVVLLDLGLPDSQGIETLTSTIQKAPGIPVVVMTGMMDEAVGIKAVNEGAQDYLIKGQTDGNILARSIRYAVERKKVQEALHKSEAVLRAVNESTINLVCVKDTQDRVIMANPAMLRFLGKSETEVIGKDDLQHVANAEQAALIRENDRRIMKTGRAETAEETVDGLDGPWTCLFTKSPYLDANGNVIGIIGVGVDITERKQDEQRLQDLLSFNQTIIGTSPVGIITLKASGRCVSVNGAAEEITGGTADQLLAQNFRHIESWKGSGLFEAAEETLASEAVVKREVHFFDTFGKEVWCEAHLAPFYFGKEKHLLLLLSDIRERKQTEEALRQSLEKETLILNSAAEGIFGLDMEGNCTFVNRSCQRMLGYHDQEDFLGKNVHDLVHNVRDDGTPYPRQECPVNSVLRDGRPFHGSVEYLRRADGTKIPVEYWSYPILKENIVSGAVSTFIDISDRLFLEGQLRQAQKMESVGVLAGGVAHDFNNILSTIVGYSHILLLKMDETDPLRGNAEEILEAAERAADLTRSLLAFSRKQVLNVKPVDMNELIKGTEQFLQRLVQENIEIRTLPGNKQLTVMADKSQIEQVLVNLAVNAQDAMPEGGCLTVQTEYAEIDDTFIVSHGYGEAGKYACVSVGDTGAGMDRETQEKIFEPFYTTKEAGKGTGLGLSVAYGIIKQHHGFINVYSEPGKGTTFRIYLPLAEAAAGGGEKTKVLLPPLSGSETILVAEDDEKIRKLTRIVLEESGYKVILARDGEEAVRKFSDSRDLIRLVILDMIMPKMGGREVYNTIMQIKPDVRVVFSTGYTADRTALEGSIDKGVDFILKPVPPSGLLHKVREVLDSSREE